MTQLLLARFSQLQTVSTEHRLINHGGATTSLRALAADSVGVQPWWTV